MAVNRICAWTCVMLAVLSCSGIRAQEDAECECVPYYLCQDGTIKTDGTDLVDVRFGLSNRAGVSRCSDPLAKCCSVPTEVKNLITTTTTESTPTDPIDQNTPPTPSTTTELPPIPPNVVRPGIGCGIRRELPTASRVINFGVNTGATHYAEFPWMMAILTQEFLNENKHYKFKCGGSLVHPSVVVTAAHCVVGIDQSTLTVRGGEWDTQSRDEPMPHQDRGIKQVMIHPEYNPRNLRNDIAVIIVDSPYNVTDNVDIICLPLQTFNFDSLRCVATGWGKDSFNQGSYQQIIRKVDLPVVPHDECQTRLRKTRLGPYYLLHDSFLCAGGEVGKDTCQGDGGGPLVCPHPNDPLRWVQAGIISWGIGCGNENPAVYTKMTHLVNWIIQQIPLPPSMPEGDGN